MHASTANKPKQVLAFVIVAIALVTMLLPGCSFERFRVGIDHGRVTPEGLITPGVTGPSTGTNALN